MKDEKFTKDDITSILSAILQGEPQDFSRTVAVPIAVVEDAISALKDDSDRDKFAIEFAEWTNKNDWMYYQSDMIWIKNSDYINGKETKELLQLFHSQKQTQG